MGTASIDAFPAQAAFSIILPAKMIEQRLKFQEILEKYPIYIPLAVVAKFLNMKPEGLRACIKQGRCPFGLAYETDDKSAYKIPTETFFLWYTNTAGKPAV